VDCLNVLRNADLNHAHIVSPPNDRANFYEFCFSEKCDANQLPENRASR